MVNVRNIIFMAAVAAFVSACAGNAPKTETTDVWAPVKPSYSEKVSAESLNQVHASCPQDDRWQNYDWAKIVPLANACVKTKDWRRLEKIGNHLAKQAYLTPWGAYYLGLAAEGRKDYPRAVWMLGLALKKAPKEGLFHYELGRIHWELQEGPEAIKEMQMASDLNPTLTDAHWVLGQIAMDRQDKSAAKKYFEKALASNPNHVPSLLALASLEIDSKDFTQAEDHLILAIKANPRSYKARVALAKIQDEQLKKYNEALANYKEIKHLAARNELDDHAANFDDRIKFLEKTLSQAAASSRAPSGEGRVTQ